MKTTNMRNIRIATMQGLKNRLVPANREQIMSELARLEHEKASLEREITIWISNQKKAQARIQQVQERVALLQHMLEGLSLRPLLTQSDEDGEKKNRKYREVNLEY